MRGAESPPPDFSDGALNFSHLLDGQDDAQDLSEHMLGHIMVILQGYQRDIETVAAHLSLQMLNKSSVNEGEDVAPEGDQLGNEA